MKTNICLMCGQEFIPNKYHPQQKFCSTKCKQEYYKRYCSDRNRKYYYSNRERLIEARRRRYSKNRKREIERIKQYREKVKQFLINYKKNKKCERCGNDDFRVLEFHHRDPAEKDIKISSAIKRGWSISRILKEIEKCQILCANCHRIVHYEMQVDEF